MDTVAVRFPGGGKPKHEDPQVVPGDFRIVQRWGVTTGSVRELGAFDPGQPLDRVLNHNGEWWVVCRDSANRWLILSDPFSLQPLHYAAVWTPQGADLIVSPQMTAAAQAMTSVGAKVESDWAGVLPSLFARHDLYDTMYDVLTPVTRLLVTRPDQAILVDEDGYKLVPRPSATEPGASYEDLLRQGVERATSEIAMTLRSANAERAVLNLSGGKDSRLVLAMLMASGIGDNLRIHAVDPQTGKPGWQRDILTGDLAISSRLVARYGLSWAHGAREREIWPDTLDGQLFTFQRHRGGRSFQFFPHSTSYYFTQPEVRFTGAGAGALRSPWATAWKGTPIWESLEHTPESFNADAMKVCRKTLGAPPIPKAVDSRALNRFVVTMRDISGGTIEGAIAAHYRSFRNRGHVGGLAWGRSMGIINSNPLLQPEFVAASHMLAPDDRDAGRMTFDLLEILDPSLNDLEFESGPWPWAGGRPQRFDWDRHPADPGSFTASQSMAKTKAQKAAFPPRPRPDMGPLIQRGLGQLREALVDAKHPGGEILGDLQQNPPTDLRGQGRLLTKLATWAHCMPDPGHFVASASPLPPRIVTATPQKPTRAFP